MLGRDRVIELLRKLVREAEESGTGQAEALYVGSHNSTTRFANSVITQNIKESNGTVYFRVLLDKRIGVTSANSLHIEDLRRCMKKAIEIARQSKPLKFFDSLPKPSEYPNIKTHYPKTATLTISDKVKILGNVFKKSKSAIQNPKSEIRVGGAFSTSETEIGIANSNNLTAYQPFTSAHLSLITSSPPSLGFANQFERDVKNIDTDKLLSTAMKKCIAKKRDKLKPGRYKVILEPPAVNEILEWLIYITFGASVFIDGTSFMTGNIGKKIMSKKLTIYDDGGDTRGFPVPFDFEGVKKKRLDIIKNGVAISPAYDTLLAKKCRKKTTGHALMPDDTEGPFPTNVFIREGDCTLDEMISMVDRGILVTRFHYVNGLLDTKTASMTGMTRDGTFYIEDGEIRYPVEDMRFTASILDAFSKIEVISKERQAFPTPYSIVGVNILPALLIKEFSFSD
ncbi:MAG: hypothetical protein A3I04_01920 [Nitrospinae bacterium RIFCSPLOWO2_02_FULL_39_110]|nr:MAG: hypothetical protein A2W53_08070 [Nitrospinae bacterium RIFCSPHIGHO2_02_39_11]OGV99492.1 MAG: hypothetical protein A3D97_01515 [Nitrospinae bacterium RIFCSPHIGHO2_12_FULL_39_42]OGW01663.1 MAG: hypothetical protein A3D20_05465 [Nitrospinae bacterium RIFCSPHIGHO2_02_FULL_39_82]OGW02564.1 MAG: hypothetical protein A2Z59_12665 [Nitrospinae bacterium RIFCSPLOWO2_02_39_17]OGW04795.1 MAG: hypothetical protein A3I04_01920 [Nitrospinae bacterium RIFCSPLOWO2_02_FULL_39_110]OGW10502.1 MAG: hypoth